MPGEDAPRAGGCVLQRVSAPAPPLPTYAASGDGVVSPCLSFLTYKTGIRRGLGLRVVRKRARAL